MSQAKPVTRTCGAYRKTRLPGYNPGTVRGPVPEGAVRPAARHQPRQAGRAGGMGIGNAGLPVRAGGAREIMRGRLALVPDRSSPAPAKAADR